MLERTARVALATVAVLLLAASGVSAQVCTQSALTQANYQTFAGCVVLSNGLTISTPLVTDVHLEALSTVTRINGAATIAQARITHMRGLRALNTVTGTLTLSGLPVLSTLDGLQLLTAVNGGLTLSQNPWLPSLDGLNALEYIGSSVQLQSLYNLTSIAALAGLRTVRNGALTVTACDNLVDLYGLHNCNATYAAVTIDGCRSLQSLNGLQRLQRVTGSVVVQNLLSLTSLSGLDGLGAVGLELRLRNVANLTSLDALGALSTVGGTLSVDGTGLTNLTGLGYLVRTGQLFVANNPALVDLTGAENLTLATGGVTIQLNPALTTLQGLATLDTVTGSDVLITNNLALVNLTGLGALRTVVYSLRVNNNPALASLDGLDALEYVGRGFECTSNAALTELALPNLRTIFGGFTLQLCPALEMLDATTSLPALRVVSGAVTIQQNNGLRNCTGVGNAVNASAEAITSFTLSTNQQLEWWDCFNASRVAQSVTVWNNAQLTTLGGFGGVTVLSNALQVYSNPQLRAVVGFASLRQAQSVSIYGANFLDDLSGLVSLTTTTFSFYLGPNRVPDARLPFTLSGSVSSLSLSAANNLTSLALWAGITSVTGGISVANCPAIVDVDLPNLRTLTAALSITGNPALRVIDGYASLLDAPTGGITVSSNVNLQYLTGFRGLVRIGALSVDGHPVLQSWTGFGFLKSCTSVYVSSNTNLTDLSAFRNLTSINGQVTLANTRLLDLPFVALRTFVGRLSVFTNPELRSVELPALSSWSSFGSTQIYDNRNVTLVSLPNVTTWATGSLSVFQCAKLVSVVGPTTRVTTGFTNVQGISFYQNPLLVNVTGFDAFTTFGGISVYANPRLSLLPAFPQVTAVTGSVRIDNTVAIDEFPFLARLTSVASGQQFQFSGNADLKRLTIAPTLTAPGLSLTLVGNPQLAFVRTFAYPAYTNLAGSYQVTGCPALTNVTAFLYSLVSIANLNLQDLPQEALVRDPAPALPAVLPTELDLPRLQRIGGAFTVRNWAGLASVGNFAQCTAIGSLAMGDLPRLVTLHGFNRVTAMPSWINLSGLPLLQHIDGFNNYQSGGVTITDCPVLQRITGFRWWRAPGGTSPLSLSDVPQLWDMSGFANLTQVGSGLSLTRTGLASLDALASWTTCGSITLDTNPFLVQIDALRRCTTASGNVRISNNAALLNVRGLVNLVSVTGSVTVTGNPLLPEIGLCSFRTATQSVQFGGARVSCIQARELISGVATPSSKSVSGCNPQGLRGQNSTCFCNSPTAPCLNGGQCRAAPAPGSVASGLSYAFMCVCPLGFRGEWCEQVDPTTASATYRVPASAVVSIGAATAVAGQAVVGATRNGGGSAAFMQFNLSTIGVVPPGLLDATTSVRLRLVYPTNFATNARLPQVQEVRVVSPDWTVASVSPTNRPPLLFGAGGGSGFANAFSQLPPRFSIAEQQAVNPLTPNEVYFDVSSAVLPQLRSTNTGAGQLPIVALRLTDITPLGGAETNNGGGGFAEYTSISLNFVIARQAQDGYRPPVLEVRLDDDNPNLVRVLFDGPLPPAMVQAARDALLPGVTDIAGQNVSCSSLLEPSSLALMGTGPQCYWSSNSALTLVAGPDHTMPSVSITNPWVRFLPAVSVSTAPLSVLPPLLSIRAPLAVVVMPAELGLCAPLTVTWYNSLWMYGRSVTYNVTRVGGPNGQNVRDVAASVGTQYTYGIASPSTTLPALAAGAWTLSVAIRNFYGYWSTAVVRPLLVRNYYIPTLTVSMPSQVFRGRPTLVTSVVRYADCVPPAYRMAVDTEWALDTNAGAGSPANVVQRGTGAAITIPKFTLSTLASGRVNVLMCAIRPTEAAYALALAAQAAGGPGPFPEIVLNTTIAPVATRLIVSVAGGEARSVDPSRTIVLDASRSFDPDTNLPITDNGGSGEGGATGVNAAQYVFQWSCEQLTQQSFLDATGCGLSSLASAQSAALVLPPGQLRRDVLYRMAVTITSLSDYRQGTATVLLSCTGTGAFYLSVGVVSPFRAGGTIRLQTTVEGVWPFSAGGIDPAYRWTVRRADTPNGVDFSYYALTPYGATFAIGADRLQPGFTWAFNVTELNTGAFATQYLTIPMPPLGGSCVVDQTTGVALSSQFTLRAPGWSPAGQLTSNLFYSFSYIVPATATTTATTTPTTTPDQGQSTPGTTTVQTATGTVVERPLSDLLNSPLLTTTLPAGNPTLQVVCYVSDEFGSRTRRVASPVTVTYPTRPGQPNTPLPAACVVLSALSRGGALANALEVADADAGVALIASLSDLLNAASDASIAADCGLTAGAVTVAELRTQLFANLTSFLNAFSGTYSATTIAKVSRALEAVSGYRSDGSMDVGAINTTALLQQYRALASAFTAGSTGAPASSIVVPGSGDTNEPPLTDLTGAGSLSDAGDAHTSLTNILSNALAPTDLACAALTTVQQLATQLSFAALSTAIPDEAVRAISTNNLLTFSQRVSTAAGSRAASLSDGNGVTATLTRGLLTPAGQTPGINPNAPDSTSDVAIVRFAGRLRACRSSTTLDNVEGPGQTTFPSSGGPLTPSDPNTPVPAGGSSAVPLPSIPPLGFAGTDGLILASDIVSVNVRNYSAQAMGPGALLSLVMPYDEPTCEGGYYSIPDTGATPECRYWDVRTQSFASDGCTMVDEHVELPDGRRGIRCECTHLTDFAALSYTRCGPLQSYVAFCVLYSLVMVFALGQCVRYAWAFDWKYKLFAFANAFHQHVLIFLIAFFRVISSAYYSSDARGWTSGGVAFVTSLPYALGMVVFSMLIAQWVAIDHFAMGGGDPFQRVRKPFIALNVVYSLLVFILFVSMAASGSLSTKQDVAVAASALLAIIALAVSILFVVYAVRLALTLTKGQSRDKPLPALVWRLYIVGVGVAVCFFLQSIFFICSVADQRGFRTHSAQYTAPFLVFDLLALCGALWLFFAAVQGAVDKKAGTGPGDKPDRSTADSGKSGADTKTSAAKGKSTPGGGGGGGAKSGASSKAPANARASQSDVGASRAESRVEAASRVEPSTTAAGRPSEVAIEMKPTGASTTAASASLTPAQKQDKIKELEAELARLQAASVAAGPGETAAPASASASASSVPATPTAAAAAMPLDAAPPVVVVAAVDVPAPAAADSGASAAAPASTDAPAAAVAVDAPAPAAAEAAPAAAAAPASAADAEPASPTSETAPPPPASSDA